MARPTPLSGFPEWLPAQRIVEQHVLDVLREVFELHGFASIETRAVEPLDQLLRKGETDKEVYVLRRLQADPDDQAAPAGGDASGSTLGLHFDLTVPLARYVLENAGHLEFPFRRYQVQKAWRGERPQEGRYREFVQADIDVIGRDTLSFHHEVEVAQVMAEAFARLPLPAGAHAGQQPPADRGLLPRRRRRRRVRSPDVMRVDRQDRQGQRLTRVVAMLVDEVGLTSEQAQACVALTAVTADGDELAGKVKDLGVAHRAARRGRRRAVASPAAARPRCAPTGSRSSRTCASRVASTTTPAPSTRPGWPASSTSARSAPAVATTRWPVTAGRRTRVSASRWASPAPSGRC